MDGLAFPEPQVGVDKVNFLRIFFWGRGELDRIRRCGVAHASQDFSKERDCRKMSFSGLF